MSLSPLVIDHGTGDLREMTTTEVAALGGAAGVPTVLAAATTYTVAAGTQALWADGITVRGTLVVNGSLRGVR